MDKQLHHLSLPLQWLAIALITLVLGLALATPGPGLDISSEESFGTTLQLQKKIAGDDTQTLDNGDSLGELLAAIVDKLSTPSSISVPANTTFPLAASPRYFLGSVAPRAPPGA